MGALGLGRVGCYLNACLIFLNSAFAKPQLYANNGELQCYFTSSGPLYRPFLNRPLAYINGPYTAPRHVYSTHYSRGSTEDHPIYHEQSCEGSLG